MKQAFSFAVRLRIAAVVVMLLAGAVPITRAAATAVSADTPSRTASGVTFTIPKDWSSQSKPSTIVLTPPEGDLDFAIVDAGETPDADTAVATAWKLYSSGASRPLTLSRPLPARNGWDERRAYSYETSPSEHLVYVATALRRGTHWTVFILKGSQATLERRGAAVNLVAVSLRPAGYKRETFAGRTPHRLDAARIEALKSFVQSGMEALDVPGVAIALVDQGQVVFEGGFGVRTLGNPTPVDANTLFMIASNTKGMSTLLLARLVDQGKLNWDEPVTQVYPRFRLGSAATTKQVLVRHLICACTGLPRKDFDWIFNTAPNTPASTTFDQLAATEPTTKFGEAFQYNNLMASAAGYIGGHIVYPNRELGAAYDAAMQSMIFQPLGMSSTTFDMKRALASNHADPLGEDVDGHMKLGSIDFNYLVLPYRPAGGAWSSAHDFIKYAQNELTLGVLPSGKRLVSEQNMLKRREHNVPVSEEHYYGMGLMDDETLGITIIHHGGDLAGYHSEFFAIPSAGVGAVILTNADGGVQLRTAFRRRLLELLYDGEPQAADDVAAAAANHKAALAKSRERLVVPAAPEVVSGLASRYRSSELGHIDVRSDATGVTFDFGLWKSHVASRKNDDGSISLITIDPTVRGFEFVVTTENGKRELVTRDGQHRYVYTESA